MQKKIVQHFLCQCLRTENVTEMYEKGDTSVLFQLEDS